MTLRLLTHLFHLLFNLCSSSLFLSISFFRADDATSVIASVSSVAQSMKLLTVSFSKISLYYSVCQLQSLITVASGSLYISCFLLPYFYSFPVSGSFSGSYLVALFDFTSVSEGSH